MYRNGDSRPSPQPSPVRGEGVPAASSSTTNNPDGSPPLWEKCPQDREGLSFKGIPYVQIIDEWWSRNGGVPQEGERNVKLYHLAVNLRAICDNNKELLMQVMPRLGLEEAELRSIVDSACKEPPKGISKMMQNIIQMENGQCKISSGRCEMSFGNVG